MTLAYRLLPFALALGCGGDTVPAVTVDAAITSDAPAAPDPTGVWLFETVSCGGGPPAGIPEYVSEYHIEATTARRVIEYSGCRAEATGIPRSESNGVVRLSEGLATGVVCGPDPCSLLFDVRTVVCPSDFPIENTWVVDSVVDDVMTTTDPECTFTWTRAP